MKDNCMKLTFFDDYWVDFRKGTTRRWYTPQLHAIAPITNGYTSLLFDPERGKYRVYYETLIDASKDGPRLLKMVESEDLVNFTPVMGADGTEVIFEGNGGVHGVSVLYDAYDPDPARRYKFCGMTRMSTGERGAHPVTLAFSADGIHWEDHSELVANPYTSDALNKLFYNPCYEEYVLMHRSAYVDRRIAVRTSKDLKNWSEPRIIQHPGAVYNTGHTEMQHYSMSANYFDGIFYGLLWNFRTDLQSNDFSKIFGVMETELVYSYDGREFLYTTGKPLVERPEAPKPGWAGLGGNDMCESRDGKFYYMVMISYQFVHGTEDSNARLGEILKEKGISSGQCIYRIRKDGFCGIENVGQGGTVITKGIELLKDDLTFNVRADCGSVRFGLMNQSGAYLEGFSLEDCVPFEFDEGVEVRPQWKEKQLSEVLKRQVRVVIELNGAVLHAMSATARPYIWQPQRSFADPQGIFSQE